MKYRCSTVWLVAGVATLWSVGASAETYPSRPIKLVVAGAAGASGDSYARVLATALHKRLGQAVVVENKPGAGQIIGTELVKSATPDGYTLLLGNAGSHSINPAIYKKLPYDAEKDFEPIILIDKSPNVCVVHPSTPASNLNEYITAAQKNQINATYGSGGNGTSSHLIGLYIEAVSKTPMLHIPYKGATPALNDVISGQVSLFCGNIPAVLPHIRNGRVKPLAVTTLSRLVELPNTKTVAEDYPGFEVVSWFALYAPRNTPKAITGRLATEVEAVLKTPEVRNVLKAQGTVASGLTGQSLNSFTHSEIAKWKKVVLDANITVEQK